MPGMLDSETGMSFDLLLGAEMPVDFHLRGRLYIECEEADPDSCGQRAGPSLVRARQAGLEF